MKTNPRTLQELQQIIYDAGRSAVQQANSKTNAEPRQPHHDISDEQAQRLLMRHAQITRDEDAVNKRRLRRQQPPTKLQQPTQDSEGLA